MDLRDTDILSYGISSELGMLLFRSLGKGLGCVLIKSTLGPGKTQKGWKLEGEGYTGAMGDKKGQFTSNLGLRWTFPSQLEGAK
jgi:hypothetical protein